MTRRDYREHVFKMLFRVEFHELEELKEQEMLYLSDNDELSDENKDEIEKRVADIKEQIEYLDKKVNENTEGWKTERMGKVELTIIRLALYEMEFDSSIPVKVSANEAIELAKKFGGDSSPSFVNGILKKFMEEE